MTMSAYDQTRQLAQILLKNEQLIDVGVIKRVVSTAMTMLPPEVRSTIEVDRLVRELEASFSIWIGVESSLEDNSDHEPWLNEKKASIDWRYWRRYERFLEEEKGWSSITTRNLDRRIDSVLEKLEDPNRTGVWDRRGLIAGHVQSGKTSHFTGLICKAIDAGYKLVIVLAGIHNSLRSQTQNRLDEGLLGYESQSSVDDGPRKVIGVGKLDPSCPHIGTITTAADNGDFRKSVAKNFHIDPDHRLLFVIKKNASVLKHLLGWIENYAQHTDKAGKKFIRDVPVLVIDDEADNASVDINKDILDEDGVADENHDPAKINGLIRRLLGFFARSAYVGYTATPFANIYIPENARTELHGEDLFPRSFIINLPAPSNYVGPVQVFGLASDAERAQEPLPIVTTVTDFLDDPPPPPGTPRPRGWAKGPGWMPPQHNARHAPRLKGEERLPESLREAIRAFIIARAGRIARGRVNEHNSMLIHVSRFTDVQERVFDQVEQEVDDLVVEIDVWNGDPRAQIARSLEAIWKERFLPAVDALEGEDMIPLAWKDVLPHLKTAASGIQLKQVNGSAGDILDYKEHEKSGLNVIAIGGDKLARGLTLEGLTVSYFLRATKLYDTLMQMGRWFGYRPGYLDLCRLYMSPDLYSWYVHVTRANEELRDMFEDMARRKLTPKDYGLKVMAHPDGLMITGAAKMRYGTTVNLSYAGSISETVVFDPSQVGRNLETTEEFVRRISGSCKSSKKTGSAEQDEQTQVWSEVPVDDILAFLAKIKVPQYGPQKARPELLSEFIELHVPRGELTSWTVALISNTVTDQKKRIGGFEVGLIKRNLLQDNEDGSGFTIRRLCSPADEEIGLTDEQVAEALKRTREGFTNDAGRSRYREKDRDAESIVRPSGAALRSVRPGKEGLLLIYPMRLTTTKSGDDGKPVEIPHHGVTSPVIGFALSFPGELSAGGVDYVVNNVYWNQEYAA